MAKNRLIFTLLYSNKTYMLSRNFSLQTAGDLKWIREFYSFDAIAFSIDELFVLNVERGRRDHREFARHLVELTRTCFMPLAAGGGIRTLDDAYCLMDAGVEKLVINSPLYDDPKFVSRLVTVFGSQSVIASVDYKQRGGRTEAFSDNGSRPTGFTAEEAIQIAQDLKCGEIYLTSIDRDGTGQGYDIEMLRRAVRIARIPVIASGGVGTYNHLADGALLANVSASSTANIFNFMADGLTEARNIMKDKGIQMASWGLALPSAIRSDAQGMARL